MLKSGEIRAEGKDHFRLVRRDRGPIDKIWRALRAANKTGGTTLKDLLQLTGLSELVVKAVLADLDKKHYLSREGGKLRLIRDRVEAPDFCAAKEVQMDLAEEALDLAQRLARFSRRIQDAKELKG
jgi:hypothetical protein